MYLSTRTLLLIGLLLASGLAISAQCPAMPQGFRCITQEAANNAAANARENVAIKNENAVLKQSLSDKDKSIEELQKLNRDNTAALTDRIHKTEVEFARVSGELIGEKAQNVSNRAIIEVLMKYARKKCMPFTIICL